ncbi:MAG: type II toxin-antitoxin system Phd/YefM family antitoxin [Polyangiaceae bacterium]
MKTAGKRSSRAAASVLQAAEFKAEALAVMRRVSETGQPVTITSRGKALVRIEPIREERRAAGYGSMRGTVEFLVSDDELVSARSDWGTLAEWGGGEARKG